MAPGFRLPESNAPVSDVTVWVVVSSFVHVTFAPLTIVSDEGLNASPFIVTVFWPAVLTCGDDEGLEDEVHPAVRTTAPTSAANAKTISFFNILPPEHASTRALYTVLSLRSLKCVVRLFVVVTGLYAICASFEFVPDQEPSLSISVSPYYGDPSLSPR